MYDTITVTASFTRPDDTTQYTARDVCGTNPATNLTFTNCVRDVRSGGAIMGVSLVDSAAQSTAGTFELWLFTAAPTAVADNAAFAPTDAEVRTVVGVVPLSTAYVGTVTSGANGNRFYTSGAINIPFRTASTTRNLYGVLVASNAYTPVAQEVFDVTLRIYQD